MSTIPSEPLDPVAVRVLGALLEKERATPDNYPLTLNALTAACNQTTNREPVMSLEEPEVARSLDELMRRGLVRSQLRSDSRVKRYRQSMTEALSLHAEEAAVMCVLMLRGAQTAGEIRTRTNRLFEFRDVPHVEVTLNSLATLATPLVMQLPRAAGQKEVRYAHLLSGEPSVDVPDAREPTTSRTDRIAALEDAVVALRAEVAELRAQVTGSRIANPGA